MGIKLNGLINSDSYTHFYRHKGQGTTNNTYSVFILALILFVPAARFDFYYVAIISVTCVVAVMQRRLLIESGFPRLLLFYFLGLIIFALGKSLVFEKIYDLKELFKILIFIMIFSTTRFMKLESFQTVLLCYISADLAISVAEFSHFSNSLTEFVSDLYHAPNHAAFAENIGSVRAMGLSPGPGQHGSLSLVLFVFFVTCYIFDKKTKVCLLGGVFSLMCLFLSQSKTAIFSLVLFLIIFIVFFTFIRRFGGFVKILLVLTLSGFFIINSQEWIFATFFEIQRISESGLAVTSLLHRFSLWDQQISGVLQSNFVLVLFGAGRGYLDFISIYHNSFDNDYVYVFVQFGVVGFIIAISLFLRSIFNGLINFRYISVIKKSILMILISGSICALSLDVISDIKIISVFAFLLAMSRSEKSSNNCAGLETVQNKCSLK
jgi:hypothetical protein